MLGIATPDRKATVLLLLAIAGCIDAIGLAALGDYFVSFMSANTTRIATSFADRDYADAAVPLGLIALFVAGATIGALMLDRPGDGASARTMLVAAALLVLASVGFGTPRPMLGVVPLPVAMGMLHVVAARYGGRTGATAALVGLGVGLAGLGRGADMRDMLFRAAAWAVLMLGAFGGALGRLRLGDEVLLAPAAALSLVGLALLWPRRVSR